MATRVSASHLSARSDWKIVKQRFLRSPLRDPAFRINVNTDWHLCGVPCALVVQLPPSVPRVIEGSRSIYKMKNIAVQSSVGEPLIFTVALKAIIGIHHMLTK